MLSEISQLVKEKYHMISLMWNLMKNKTDKQNTNRGMDTWNWQLSEGGVWGDWIKEGEEISQRAYGINYRHRQQCGDGQREMGLGLSEYGQEGGSGDICTESTTIIKLNKIK